jgi:pantetheine-phosphate adenylyltransferase
MSIAVYAGTFDPFTKGHLSVVRQATEVFNLVYLVFAENPLKTRTFDLKKMMKATEMIWDDEGINNITVTRTDKLIADFAASNGASYLVRGLRNPNDFFYEENIAKINKEINPCLNTIYFRADNEVISSSFVRELYRYGNDVWKYVGSRVLGVMEESRIDTI